MDGLNKRQSRFVIKCARGTSPTDAAMAVYGLTKPNHAARQATRLLQNPKVLTALQDRVTAAFIGDLQPLAVKVFKELLEDEATQPRLKYDVAKYVNDKAHELHKLKTIQDVNAQNVNAMSEEELHIFIRKTKRIIVGHDTAAELGLIEGDYERIS